MSTGSQAKIDVAIVGGGIGGLCVAIALLKHEHINLQIYEAAQQFSEIGAGVSLAPNALRALTLIDPALESVKRNLATGNASPSRRNVVTTMLWGEGPHAGTELATQKNETGQQTFHRARLLDALVQLIPNGLAHFSKRLITVEEPANEKEQRKVRLLFADGKVATAHCVIGADGLRSRVRGFVTGPEALCEPAFTHTTSTRLLVPMEAAIKVLGEEKAMNCYLHIGRGAMIMSYPIDHGATMNANIMDCEVDEWEGTSSTRPADLTALRKRFNGWSADVGGLLDLAESYNIGEWSVWQLPPLRSSFRDRVVLMGDAKHAMAPYIGQGAGQAMEDAFVLGALLGRARTAEQIPLAFQAYDSIRRPRAERVKKSSLDAAKVFTLRADGVMDDAEKLQDAAEWWQDWIWNRDIDGERREAEIEFDLLLERKSSSKAFSSKATS